MHITQIIKHPILTEKNYQKINDGYYVFAVDSKATKPQIKAAFETIFEVEVQSINVANIHPKSKKVGRFTGFTKSEKKAIIKLKPGQVLDIFNENKKK